MKKLGLLIPILAMMGGAAAADTLVLTFNQYATDNLYQMKSAFSDQISQIDISWDKSLKSFSFFADADYSYLRNTSRLSDLRFNGGADYLYSLGQKTALYFSLEGGAALYRSEYKDFNHSTLRAVAAMKTYLAPTSILKVNAQTEYRSYSLSLFDFVSQTVWASLDKYFETRTTLKADLGWGYKYYPHPVVLTDAAAAGPSPTATPVSGSSGYGNSGAPGKGPGWGGQSGRGSLFYSGTAQTGMGIQIASVSGIIAQGIGDSIGLRIAGARQWRLSGGSPFTSIEEYYMVDNPTYDNFSWTGYALSGQLTAEIPWDIELKLGYTKAEKEFPGIESWNLDGTDLGIRRQDRRSQLDLRIEKNFSRLSLFLTYTYIKNTSNDPLFGWSGYNLSGGLSWNLFFGQSQ
jgi:hypothetical protein